MATVFAYSRPDESIIGANCSGSVDADFTVASACNGVPGDPVKKTGGLAVTAVPLAATSVGVVAVCHHNLAAGGTVAVTGDLTATITTGAALPGNNIPLNAYALVAPPVTVSTGLTFTTAGVVVGEFWAGKLRTLERGLRVDAQLDPPDPFAWEGEFGSIPPNDIMTEARRLTGEAVVTGTGLGEIEDWYRSTRRGILPSLIIPFADKTDAWLVTFKYSVKIGWRNPAGDSGSIYTVSFEFTEIPRTRW